VFGRELAWTGSPCPLCGPAGRERSQGAGGGIPSSPRSKARGCQPLDEILDVTDASWGAGDLGVEAGNEKVR